MNNDLRHKNSFDFLKLIFALLVVVSHSSILSKVPYPEFFLPQVKAPIGQVAVWGFFVMSGYLVSGSLDRSRNRMQFLLKRFYRIYPAHILSAFLATFLLGALLTSLRVTDYFSNWHIYAHFIDAIFLIPKEDCLPGVFSHNPLTCAVNGNLWTLRYEILFYILFSVLFTLSFIKKRKVVAVTIVLAFIAYYSWYFFNSKITSPVANYYLKYFTQLAVYFSSGVFLYYFPIINSRNCKKIFLLFCPIFIVCWLASAGFYLLLMPVLVPVIVISAGLCKPLKVNVSEAIGDVSYGIYIYGFTIQQTILQLFPSIGIYTFLISSAITCLIVGYLSWHLVEKKWLRRSR